MALTRINNQALTNVTSAGLPTLDRNKLPAGTVLQVKQTHLTAGSSQSISANTRAEISGLNVSITPTSTSSKILITVRWAGEGSSTSNQDFVFGIRRDSTDVGNPASAGSRNVGITGIAIGHTGADASTTQDKTMYQYLDSPSTTSQITYKATVLHSVAQTLYNQRTVSDSNASSRERTTSTITVMEIAG